MAEIKLNNVCVEAGGARLLHNASANFRSGELIALIGPNGAGKSTLLKCALALMAPSAGTVTLNGKAIAELSPIERARLVSYLPQSRPLAWPVRVRDVVALGRYAYGASTTKLTGEDAAAVTEAMDDCDLDPLAERRTDTLSGGELARVHCARAFAANAPLLIADEPVASLDPSHQFQIMALIRAYVDNGGGAVVVLHDIALAARFADRLIWMKDGEINANGAPEKTLTAAQMKKIFAVDAVVAKDQNGWSLTVTGSCA
jgi:iron complex transport system ATP-binding protein